MMNILRFLVVILFFSAIICLSCWKFKMHKEPEKIKLTERDQEKDLLDALKSCKLQNTEEEEESEITGNIDRLSEEPEKKHLVRYIRMNFRKSFIYEKKVKNLAGGLDQAINRRGITEEKKELYRSSFSKEKLLDKVKVKTEVQKEMDDFLTHKEKILSLKLDCLVSKIKGLLKRAVFFKPEEYRIHKELNEFIEKGNNLKDSLKETKKLVKRVRDKNNKEIDELMNSAVMNYKLKSEDLILYLKN